ncbi:hypothetical protein BDV37DRAFT_268838 [Aspergillus pseudonomiae]|uniref:Uncharacterized protein n=1 Tax=Aspergillus pseudonomiae TaxID=1506151 RepID=A0A5N7DNV3_9EURO|nr:uncharacterized protein BDV37DRAFT_268838 [Aspergillus pseudonomiae]KAE8408096.1 hypothetical protein BDV37DRAFT_268838 [Aspergillus pseudonomiae]
MGLLSLFSRSSASESSARTWTLAGHAKLRDAQHRQYPGLPSDINHDLSIGKGSYSAYDEQSRESHPNPLRQDNPQAQHAPTPVLEDIFPQADTNDTKVASLDSPADSLHLVKGSGRFVTFLRSRKSRRQKSPLSAPKLHNGRVAGGSKCCNHKCTVNDNTGDHRSANGRRLLQSQNSLMGPYEARKASDRTTLSHKSDLTSMTVSHHPSKHTLAPIALCHRENVRQNPVDELGEPCRRVSSYYPFLEPSVTTTSSATQASSYCGDMNPEIAQMAGIFAKCGNPFDQESFRDHENLSLVSSSRTVSRDSTWSLHIDRHTAAIAFNELAARLHLDPLDLDQSLSTPEVFCNEGDLKMAARIYDYFAKQVLSAENVRDRIETTVRRGELPIDLIGMFDHGASRKFSSQVLSVGWVFKALLAGLPGGILGSARLYRVLVNICYGRIAERNESNGDGGGGLSPPGHTKLQAIGLAVLALTTPMQLNLICAFFGLCAMLQYETERAGVVDELGGDAGRSGLTFGLSSVERLGHVLGPLLTPDGGDGGDGGQDTFRAIEREIENQRVMTMLISSWGSINQQLRVWQNQGSVARLGSFFRLFSWEQPLADSECHVGG